MANGWVEFIEGKKAVAKMFRVPTAHDNIERPERR